MKIVILQGAFFPVPPVLGGAVEKMWFALGKYFASCGHEVIHISRTFNNLPDHDFTDGVNYWRVKGYKSPKSGTLLKWRDLLYSMRAIKRIPSDSDIIISNTFWAPILLSKFKKLRCYVDVQRIPKGQMKFYTSVARLRANSSYVEEKIKNEIATKYYNRVCTIPNPLPFEITDEGYALNKTKVLLYAGRVHPEKGLDLLVKAFREVAKGWKLKIVGPAEVEAGGGGETYLNHLKHLANGFEVEFTGPVYDMSELNRLYREASVFVYPSVAEKGETFGLAPLESMAWGCVPIVSDLTCFKDFIISGKNGLSFDHRSRNAVAKLAEAINQLTGNPELLAQLSNAALNVRISHSTSTIGDLFLQEFATLVANHKNKYY